MPPEVQRGFLAQLERHPLTTIIMTMIILSAQIRSPLCAGQAPLCGQLEIYKQQKWVLGPPTVAEQSVVVVRPLGTAEHSANLQQCLQRCCAMPDCSAISFSGFLQLFDDDANNASSSLSSSSASAANCALFQCPAGDGECPLTDATDGADQGLLSVRLRRKEDTAKTAKLSISATPESSQSTESEHNVSDKSSANRAPNDEEIDEDDQSHILSLHNVGTSVEDDSAPTAAEQQQQQQMLATTASSPEASSPFSVRTTTISTQLPTTTTTSTRTTTRKRTKSLLDFGTWDERFPLRAEATPVWAVGLAIVITVICLGLIASLFCAFLCYRRHKLRMRTMDLSGPKKMPTLHAFNPS